MERIRPVRVGTPSELRLGRIFGCADDIVLRRHLLYLFVRDLRTVSELHGRVWQPPIGRGDVRDGRQEYPVDHAERHPSLVVRPALLPSGCPCRQHGDEEVEIKGVLA